MLVVLVLCAAPARAQEVPRALLSDAQAEYDLGHFKPSLDLFEKLYKLKPIPGLLFNIAQCHRKLGELDAAANTYRSFLVKADPESREAERARDLLTEVEDAIRTERKAADAPPHGTAPLPATDQPVKVAAAPAAPPPPAAKLPPAWAVTRPAPPPPAPSHKAAFVLGGAGLAALAAGAVLGLKSRSAGNDLAGSLHSGAAAASLADAKKSDAKVADVLFALGGAVALGAVIAW